MTIGEKIKYYRTRLGLTQSQLAIATGIHLVSIKKYETNKMEPQLPQIEKLANALAIGTNALLDFGNFRLGYETVGDVMGVIIMLCNSGILRIDGTRDSNNSLIPDSITLHFEKNHLLSHVFAICPTNAKEKKLSTSDDLFAIKVTDAFVARELIKWEKINYIYNDALAKRSDTCNDAFYASISAIKEIKDQIELEVQRSMILIDRKPGSISVKMTPIDIHP